jgi:hypothetical protein
MESDGGSETSISPAVNVDAMVAEPNSDIPLVVSPGC